MKKVEIDVDKCKGCLLCTTACPRQLIIQSRNFNKSGYKYVEVTDQEKCNSCSFCAIMCPDMAIKIYK